MRDPTMIKGNATRQLALGDSSDRIGKDIEILQRYISDDYRRQPFLFFLFLFLFLFSFFFLFSSRLRKDR